MFVASKVSFPHQWGLWISYSLLEIGVSSSSKSWMALYSETFRKPVDSQLFAFEGWTQFHAIFSEKPMLYFL